jgi:hypothetical protein
VVDEADMLLSGGFAKDVAQLLLIFRQAEKELSLEIQAVPTEPASTSSGAVPPKSENESTAEATAGSLSSMSEGQMSITDGEVASSGERVRSWVEERGEDSDGEGSAHEADWQAEEREDRRQAQAGGIWDTDVAGEMDLRNAKGPPRFEGGLCRRYPVRITLLFGVGE